MKHILAIFVGFTVLGIAISISFLIFTIFVKYENAIFIFSAIAAGLKICHMVGMLVIKKVETSKISPIL